MRKATLCGLLCLLLCCLPCGCAQNGGFDEARQADEAIAEQIGCKPGHVLSQRDWFPAGSSAGDWLALTLRTADVREDYAAYLAALEAYVTDAYAQNGCLDKTRATEYHRIALTAHALGADPTAFGQKPDGTAVDLIEDGVLSFEDLESQGLNSVIYALLSLDACGKSDDAAVTAKRETLLQTLLASQETDGGFGYMPASSEPDMTAMALQALAPYSRTYADAVSAALDYLAAQITDNGTFCFMQTESAETTAQALLALCTLGIDPASDARFAALPDGLLRFRLENGLYRHTTDDTESDLLATQQCLLARTELYRLRER